MVIMPPRHRTSARAKKPAQEMMELRPAEFLVDRTEFIRMDVVSVSKSDWMVSSTTRVLMVFAPVMPSLKFAVILELISRISRFPSI